MAGVSTVAKRRAMIALAWPAGMRIMPPATGSGPAPPTPPPGEIDLFYTGTTLNRNIHTDALAAGWDGTSLVTIVAHVVGTVGSTSTGSPALQTGSGYPAGMPAIALFVDGSGRIEGKGGAGAPTTFPDAHFPDVGANGSPGGTAFQVSFATTVTNNGGIWGGGGGGGAGGAPIDSGGAEGGAGGGGAGINGGAAGSGGTATPGTALIGGTGDPGSLPSGAGGAGGGPGLVGIAGVTAQVPNGAGGLGGEPGNYVTGNSNVTWLLMGDVRGGVS